MKATIYLIAGPNGVGKTTFAREFLPKEVKCVRFMNADEVARGLSPFAPEAAAIRAGRVVLGEIRSAIRSGGFFRVGVDPCGPRACSNPAAGQESRLRSRNALPERPIVGRLYRAGGPARPGRRA